MKQTLFFLILTSTFMPLSGCVTGPKTKEMCPMDWLNGTHYEARPDVLVNNVPVPIIKRRRAASLVDGHLTWMQGQIPTPLSQHPVRRRQQKAGEECKGR